MSDSVPPSPFKPTSTPPPPPPPASPPPPPHGTALAEEQYGQAPLEYYAGRSAPRVPTCVKVLAIIGIVISSLAIISLPLGLAAQMIQTNRRPTTQAANQSNPVEDIVSESWLKGYQYAMNGVNFLLSIVKLVLCIGALKLLRWARGGIVKLNIVYLGLAGIGTVVFLFVMLPRLMSLMNSTTGVNQIAAIVGIVGGFMGLLFSFGLPLVFIYYFTRPHVRAAFEGQPVIKSL